MQKGYPNLELIEYKFLRKLQDDYPEIFVHYYPRIYMEVFNQIWGSTALGFGGVGGSAMTNAYTTVVSTYFLSKTHTETNIMEMRSPEFHGVFFDGRFAYMVKGGPGEIFSKDLANRNMVDIQTAISRYETESSPVIVGRR